MGDDLEIIQEIQENQSQEQTILKQYKYPPSKHKSFKYFDTPITVKYIGKTSKYCPIIDVSKTYSWLGNYERSNGGYLSIIEYGSNGIWDLFLPEHFKRVD